MPELWRQGSKVPINVYDGERPVCQCQTVEDAKRIVEAINSVIPKPKKRVLIAEVDLSRCFERPTSEVRVIVNPGGGLWPASWRIEERDA